MLDFKGFAQVISAPITGLAILIALALLSGIVRAVVLGEYEWRKLADFLRVMVVPYVGGYVIVAALAYFFVGPVVPAGLAAIPATVATGVYVTAVLALTARIVGNLKDAGVVLSQGTTYG